MIFNWIQIRVSSTRIFFISLKVSFNCLPSTIVFIETPNASSFVGGRLSFENLGVLLLSLLFLSFLLKVCVGF